MKLTNFLKKLTVILNKIPDEEYATQLQDSACAGFDAIKAFAISRGKSELWIQRNLERVLDEAAAKVEAHTGRIRSFKPFPVRHPSYPPLGVLRLPAFLPLLSVQFE